MGTVRKAAPLTRPGVSSVRMLPRSGKTVIRVGRTPDASQVLCSGQGLESPRLGGNNRVQVDCGLAGSSVLFVAVLGPGGQQGQVGNAHPSSSWTEVAL